jgi:hypothetical protein
MRLEPQRAGRHGRIYSYLQPPGGFVATAMYFAMVPATQRDDKLIADLSTECPGLGEAQMMSV